MAIQTCEQQALDNSWDLSRTSACHIAVLNNETGQIRDSMLQIVWKVDTLLWALAPIYLSLIGLAIGRMWGKK